MGEQFGKPWSSKVNVLCLVSIMNNGVSPAGGELRILMGLQLLHGGTSVGKNLLLNLNKAKNRIK